MQKNQNLRKTFGQRVRDLRNSQGFSQEAFADRCGFVRTYMSRIETGTANPSLEAAKVLADGLGLSLSELLQGLWSSSHIVHGWHSYGRRTNPSV